MPFFDTQDQPGLASLSCPPPHLEMLEPRLLLSGDGLFAIYFNNDDFTGNSVTRIDSTVDFNWGSGSPDAAIGSNTFSARWGGEIQTIEAGTYTFRSTMDDGANLFINGKQVIDQFSRNGSAAPFTGSIEVEANQRYSIVYEFREDSGNASAKLEWKRPGQSSFQVIPQAQLYSLRYDLPANANVINIKTDYGAIGDGIADDWWAIQQAISDNMDGGTELLYLPAGTYSVSKPLYWRNFNPDQTPDTSAPFGGWNAWVGLRGEQRDATVLRLPDNTYSNAPSYSSTDFRPNAVIYTASADDSFAYSDTTGAGNQAFFNSVIDLTVNVGQNNPGAVGIDYQVSNFGELRNVAVRSEDGQGHTGVRMIRDDNGPGMITDVTVSGFDTGMRMSGDVDAMTLEDITLIDQNIVGLAAGNATLAVRGLESINSIQAVDVDGRGHLTLVDSRLTGGSGSATAIVNDSRGLLLRDVEVEGYGTSLTSAFGGTGLTGSIDQYAAVPDEALFSAATDTRLLQPKDTPRYSNADSSDWVYVNHTASDDSPAFQTAINTALANGSDTIYLRKGGYTLNSTVVIPTGIKRIVGHFTSIGLSGSFFDSSTNPQPIFRIESNGSDPVTFENIRFSSTANSKNGAYGFEHVGSADLALQLVTGELRRGTYRAASGAGDLYLENISASGYEMAAGQSGYFRQWNVEGPNTHLTGQDVDLYMLGVKTENRGTLAELSDGSQLELLGGFLYGTGSQPDPTNTAIELTDSAATLSFRTTSFNASKDFPIYVRDTRGSDTRELARTDAPSSGSTRHLTLYSSQPGQTLSLSPTDDAFVRSGQYSGVNYGASTQLQAKDDSGDFRRQSYLKFDLESYLSVSKATLNLRAQGWSSPAVTIDVFRSNDTAWSESTITYANRPATSGAAVASFQVSETIYKDYQIDLTTLITDAVANGDDQVTLVLVANGGANGVRFVSEEAGTDGPSLNVTGVSVPAFDTLAFSDNFNDGNLNGWVATGGTWSVASGQARQDGNSPDARLRYTGAGSSAWTDYRVEADLRSTDNDSVGLMFRVQDADNYYRAILSQQLGVARLEKIVAGVSTILAQTSATYATGQTNRMSITVSGNSLFVSFGGTNLFGEITDNTFSTGSIGLYSHYNDDSFYDNIQVYT